MQKYPITEEQLCAALANARVEGEHIYIFLPRLTLGEELPAVQFPACTTLEQAWNDISTNILPLIRAGRLGVPAKTATHIARLTIH
jgi:hypothetical protein